MKLLTANQIREWDAFTIQKESITSFELMERAAAACFEWIKLNIPENSSLIVCCGKGNNGGDGLAIARMLLQAGFSVEVYILEFGKIGSPDFQLNLQQAQAAHLPLHFIQGDAHFPKLHNNNIVIDALFGSGLRGSLEGLALRLVEYINESEAEVIAIDLPSGLPADTIVEGSAINASVTLSFETYKRSFLFQEHGIHLGRVVVLPIGLSPDFPVLQQPLDTMITGDLVASLLKHRARFSNKGHFGHALLLGGSYGKMGAAVLAAKACLRSGTGLLTCFLPQCGYHIMQTSVPEAMVITGSAEREIADLPEDVERYSAIGVGPGLGTSEATAVSLSYLVRRYSGSIVIDADGLNLLAAHPTLLTQLPSNSILTPHPKEFDRLFGKHEHDLDRMEAARRFSKELGIVIVLKGHHTMIATPEGSCFFNTTGNAGMAKGGSGDVLTGIITGLLAQGYEARIAALIAVYLHGRSGDGAAAILGHDAMLPGDMLLFLPAAFEELRGQNRKPLGGKSRSH